MVAIGAARRALDGLIQLATTTRGTFRSSKLDERPVVASVDRPKLILKIWEARALMHERCKRLYQKVCAGQLPDGRDLADMRAICAHATDMAIETATMVYHFAGNIGLHHPHAVGPGCCAI